MDGEEKRKLIQKRRAALEELVLSFFFGFHVSSLLSLCSHVLNLPTFFFFFVFLKNISKIKNKKEKRHKWETTPTENDIFFVLFGLLHLLFYVILKNKKKECATREQCRGIYIPV